MKTIRSEDTTLLALAIVIGFFSGLGALGFIFLIDLFRNIFWSPWSGVFTGFSADDLKVLLIPLLPALGGLLVGPIGALFPAEAKGQGVPEVMESVIMRGGILRMRTFSSGSSHPPSASAPAAQREEKGPSLRSAAPLDRTPPRSSSCPRTTRGRSSGLAPPEALRRPLMLLSPACCSPWRSSSANGTWPLSAR